MALNATQQAAIFARLSLLQLESLPIALSDEFWRQLPARRHQLSSLREYPLHGLTTREAALAICTLHGESCYSSLLFVPFSLGLISAVRNNQTVLVTDLLLRRPAFNPAEITGNSSWTSYTILLALMRNNTTAAAQLLGFFEYHFEHLPLYSLLISYGYITPTEQTLLFVLNWIIITANEQRSAYMVSAATLAAEEPEDADPELRRVLQQTLGENQAAARRQFEEKLRQQTEVQSGFFLGYAEVHGWFRIIQLARNGGLTTEPRNNEYLAGVAAAHRNRPYYFYAKLAREQQIDNALRFNLATEDVPLTVPNQIRALSWLATQTLVRLLGGEPQKFPAGVRLLLRYVRVIRERASAAIDLIEAIYLDSPARNKYLDTLRLFVGQNVKNLSNLSMSDLLLAGAVHLLPAKPDREELADIIAQLPQIPDDLNYGAIIEYVEEHRAFTENRYLQLLHQGWAAGQCWAVARVHSEHLGFALNSFTFAAYELNPYSTTTELCLIRTWREYKFNYDLHVYDWFLIETLAPDLTIPEVLPGETTADPPTLVMQWLIATGAIFETEAAPGHVYFHFVTARGIEVLRGEGIELADNAKLTAALAQLRSRITRLLTF